MACKVRHPVKRSHLPVTYDDSRGTKGRELAVVEISKVTSIVSDDVIDTMTRLGMLKYRDGEHNIIATPVRREIFGSPHWHSHRMF